MHLGRYVPNEYKVFRCNRCTRALSNRPNEVRRRGFNGALIMSPKVPVVHQERWAL